MELRYLDLETMAKILFSLLRQISNYPRILSLDPYALSRAMRVSSPSPSAMSSSKWSLANWLRCWGY
jgi:hypothetical protein